MPVTFKIPKSPQKSIEQINEFKGVDFTNSPANCDINKSPNAVNMIRDVPGKVRKRMGYKLKQYYGKNLLNNTASSTGIFTVNTDKSVNIVGNSGTLTIGTVALTAGLDYKICGITKWGNVEAYGLYVYDGGTLLCSITNTNVDENYFIAESNITVTVVLEVTNPTNTTVYPAFYYRGEASNDYVPYGISGAINGVHSRKGDSSPLYHIGTNMVKDNVVLYSGANDAISHSWQMGQNLYILDGKKMLQWDGTTCQPVENVAYVPTTTIAKSPNGGGTQYEAYNLIGTGFINEFAGTSGDADYYLDFGDLNDTAVKAWILDAQGNWVVQTEGTHFSVNRTYGIVNFNAPPGESPVPGRDNVKIEAYRNVSGYADRINKCRFGTRFGVNGAFDRLFVSGNPDAMWLNADWHSQMWDCTYFPDLGLSTLGSAQSAIVGYSIISNYLAAHKDEMEQDLSIILREGDLVDNEPSFRIINTLQGAGAIAQNSFAYLCTEPIFLTRSGLFAVTAQDITGEKYAQSRSFYLNGKLTNESLDALQNSYACIYKDMYLLSVAENRLYILDGLQPMRTDKSEPYSTRQYAGFYCKDIPARIMWESENKLFFGTSDGRICEFYTDKDSIYSYSDEWSGNLKGNIFSKWETPDIDGQIFYKNKTLRYIAVRLGAAQATSVDIYGMEKGIWRLLREDTTTGRYLVFSNLIFSKFSFSSDMTQKISHTKVKIKKVDKYRIRLENNQLNEPFSIYDIGLEYVENGNYKG